MIRCSIGTINIVVTQREDTMSPARANAVLSLRYNYFG